MIDYVSGKISSLSPTRLVIDNQGIGYCFEISLQTFSAMEGKNEGKIYLQSQVNPRDGITIDYGFATLEERELFQQITGVSGMGSSTARMILSSLSPEELRDAILSENVNKLKSVKGVGLKSAQRLILELKDKIVRGDTSDASEGTLLLAATSETVEEASRALLMLGFSKPNVNKAIQAVLKKESGAKVEDIIRSSLKIL